MFRGDRGLKALADRFGDLNLLYQLRNFANALGRIEGISGGEFCELLAIVVPGSVEPMA
jgi:hypothetical protein